MTVSLKIGRQGLDIDLDAAIEVNNRLSSQYKTEPSPEKRRELIAILYRLNLPLFRKWKLFNFDEKEDYEQEAFFWISRALDTFDPQKGAFLAWLKRYYVAESQRQYLESKAKRQKVQEAAQALPSIDPQEPLDTLFWEEAKALLGPDWPVVRAVLFESQSITDLAKAQGISRTTLDSHYRRGLDTLRAHLVKRAVKPSTLQESPGEGEWVGPKKFCRIMDISAPYLKDLLNPDRPAEKCPYLINPLHYTPLPGGRIRDLVTPSRGRGFPEILRRRPG
jgi:DNA-directed RNA polymerase specialized sigma24 family protein